MHLKCRSLILFALASLAIACSDQPTVPVTKHQPRAQPLFDLNDGSSCEPWMVICDGEPEYPTNWVDDGYEEVGPLEVSFGDGPEIQQDHAVPESYYGLCPSTVIGWGLSTLQIPTQDGGGTQTAIVETYGTWTWKRELSPSSAFYNWPPGYHSAINLPSVTVQISYAEGKCFTSGNGVIVRWGPGFYGVNARYPRRRGTTLTSASEGGGGSENCHEEWVVIEIDYGDGKGWQTYWEGYATVCE